MRHDLPWSDGLDGARVCYTNYFDKQKGKYYRNYTITCGKHPGCYKTRGITEARVNAGGKLEGLAFLHAWRQVEWPTEGGKPTHRQEMPKAAQAREFLHSREEELRLVYVALHDEEAGP